VTRFGVTLALLVGACGGRAAPPTQVDGGDDASSDASTDAADGAAATNHPDFTSGTRLRARTWVSDGVTVGIETSATSMDQVWYDQQLGVPCTFVTRGDGARCEPVPSYLDPAGGGFPVFGFADALCGSERVVTGPVGSAFGPWRAAYCAEKRYARILEPAGDAIETNSYEVGPALTGAAWYMKPLDQPDACFPVDIVPPADFRRTARKTTPTDFVGAHLETIRSGRRLSPIMLVADDGTRQRVGWHDEDLNFDCSARPSEGGKTRCLPNAGSAFVLPGFFSEDCKLTLAIPDNAGAKAGDLVKPVQAAPGIRLDAYYRLGAAAKKIYERSENGECVESIFFAGAYPLIDEVLSSRMDELTLRSTVVGRFLTTSLVDAEGTVDRSTFTLFEASSNTSCAFAPTSDGKTRCLPSTALNIRYGDAACTPSAPLVSVPPGGPSPDLAIRWKGDVCSGGYELASIGSAVAGPDKTYDTNAYGVGCYLNPFATPGTLSYFALGQPVSPDLFPAVELVTE
jgi:hypothetical protein